MEKVIVNTSTKGLNEEKNYKIQFLNIIILKIKIKKIKKTFYVNPR
jgi:hypothetical protein